MKDATEQKQSYMRGMGWARTCVHMQYTVDRALAPLAGKPPAFIEGFIDGLKDVEGVLHINADYVAGYLSAHKAAYQRYVKAHVGIYGKPPHRKEKEMTLKGILIFLEPNGLEDSLQ